MAALGGSVSRRYARALFSVGSDNGRFESYGRELADFAEMFETSADLRQALTNPVITGTEKRAIIEAILPRLGAGTEVRRFVLLLLDRGRLLQLPRIARDYQRLTDERLGQVRGKVVSATPLDATAFDQIRSALEKRMGKKVLLETSVDPEILGGVIAQVGDLVLDGSLRNRLNNLSRKLLN